MVDAAKELSPEEKAERDAELERVGNTPAIYVDQWWSTIWASALRLTFGEEVAGKSYYRAAILLELSDAKALRDHLTHRIARMEEKAKKIAERDAAAASAASESGGKDG